MQTETPTLLLIDDDADIRSLLQEYFTKSNFKVIGLADGRKLNETLQDNKIDLVILDVMLPGEDGFALCQKIRHQSDLPIIMLTAVSDETDRILGIEIGADDYLSKPFSVRELLARVKGLLRRQQRSSKPLSTPRFILFNQWRVDLLKREILDPQGNVLLLSGLEFSLLSLFLSRPNQIIDRDTISEITRKRENNPLERGIDVQISRLRHRLKDDQRQLLRTVRNQGYIFCCDVEYEL